MNYPISSEVFEQLHEHLTGEPTTNEQRRLYTAAVRLINDAHARARRGAAWEPLETQLQKIAGSDGLFLRRFASSLANWCASAYQCGMEATE